MSEKVDSEHELPITCHCWSIVVSRSHRATFKGNPLHGSYLRYRLMSNTVMFVRIGSKRTRSPVLTTIHRLLHNMLQYSGVLPSRLHTKNKPTTLFRHPAKGIGRYFHVMFDYFHLVWLRRGYWRCRSFIDWLMWYLKGMELKSGNSCSLWR